MDSSLRSQIESPFEISPFSRRGSKSWLLHGFTILFFVILTNLALPFEYAQEGASGAYLVPVINKLDPTLFANDPIAASLGHFDTLYYTCLTRFGILVNLEPGQLGRLSHLLYIASRVGVVLALYLTARLLLNNLLMFVLLAVWLGFGQISLFSATGLFRQVTMHHGWPAYLLGLLATLCVLRHQYYWWGGLLGLTLLFHPLVGLHLLVVTGIPVLIYGWSQKERVFLSSIPIGVAAGLYLLFYAPPSMSPEAASFFVAVKANTVSTFHQSALTWVVMVMMTSLAVILVPRFLSGNHFAHMLRSFVLAGTGLGLLLSLVVELYPLARVVQFQPSRIFVWVSLFVYLLLAMEAVRALQEQELIGWVLLGIVLYRALGSVWALVFLALAFVWALALVLGATISWLSEDFIERLTVVGVSLFVIAVVLAFFIAGRLPFESVGYPVGVFIAITLLVFILRPHLGLRYRQILLWSLAVLVAVSITVRSRSSHLMDLDRGWDEVRAWVAQNTEEEARFLTPPHKEHFRTIALRTSVNEGSGYLIWVDPPVFETFHSRVLESQSAYHESRWHVEELFGLAHQWSADYVIVQGEYEPLHLSPLFASHTDNYWVFAVPAEW
jgi:hypothetical protein